MATIFRARRNAVTGSGGKIVRGRRVPVAASPYLRPTPTPPIPENPNWLVGLVSPATRMIVNGAGKLISSVFGSESSSSSYSSGSDSSSDDDISSQGAELLNQKNQMPSEAKKSFEEHQPIVKKSEVKLAIEKLLMQETFSREECDRLTKIIQSRVVDFPTMKDGEDWRQKEMPDRTVGSSIFAGDLQPQWQTKKSPAPYLYLGDGTNSISQAFMPNISNTAVIEAKKWLEEKKLESSSKSKLDHGMCTLNTVMVPHVTQDEVGSPADMAKSYMRARPPWASPSLSHLGSKSPSPTGIHLFKDETPYAAGNHSLSSSKLLKRNSSAIGSWNILEEIRRVRTKATEDILGPLAFKQSDLSAAVLHHKGSQISSAADKTDEVDGIIHDLNSSPATNSVDAFVNLAAGVTTSDGCPEPKEKLLEENLRHGTSFSATLVSELIYDGPGKEALSSSPAVLVSEPNQGLQDIRLDEGLGVAPVTHQSLVPGSISVQHNGLQDCSTEILNFSPKAKSSEDIQPVLQSDAGDIGGLNGAYWSSQQPSSRIGENVQAKESELLVPKETHSIDDPRSQDGSHSTQKVNGLGDRITANGIPSSASSLSAGLSDPNLRPSDKGVLSPISSSHGKMATGIPVTEICELLSEASVEVPIANETDSIASGSQNSSSSHYKESSQTQHQLNSSQKLANKSSSRVDNQRGKKIGRYKRRGGRGRGK